MIPILAQIIGYLAMATVFCSFQVKNPKGTLLVLGAATGLFSIHFGLLGAVVGCTLNVLNVLRSIAIITTDSKKLWGKLLMHTFAWLYAAAPFFFLLIPSVEVGIPDFILGVIMMINTYFFWTRRENPIRLGQFFMISPGWIWYNYLAGSLPGIITECLNMISVAIYYLRQWMKREKKASDRG